MNYEGKVTLSAERLAVWEFLLDVDRFAACMPGVEGLSKVDERTFVGTMKSRVGPFSGTFDFQARIVESEPPVQLTAQVEGTDALTKSTVTSGITMELAELGPSQTELSYKATVEVKGRLAIIGDLVIRATGMQVIDEFFKRLRERV